jgi:hypothetical protein
MPTGSDRSFIKNDALSVGLVGYVDGGFASRLLHDDSFAGSAAGSCLSHSTLAEDVADSAEQSARYFLSRDWRSRAFCRFLINQQHVAGAWYLSTYASVDAAPPTFSSVKSNLSYFFGFDGPATEDNCALIVALIGFAGICLDTSSSKSIR